MIKIGKLILGAFLLFPLIVTKATAATVFTGTTNQQVNFGGVPQPVTGTFSVNGSTLAVTNVNGQNLNVAVAAPLPAGTNNIGTVSGSSVTAYQGGTWTIASTLSGSTVAVVGVNGGPIGTAPFPISTISQSSQSVTTASVQFFAANPNRKGIECTALPGNTDFVTCAFASTALTTDSIIITAYGSWEPAKGVIATNAFSCISNSGTQVIRCVEYSTP